MDSEPPDPCRYFYNTAFGKYCLRKTIQEIKNHDFTSNFLRYNLEHYENVIDKRRNMNLLKKSLDILFNGKGKISRLEYDASNIILYHRRD